LCLSEIEHGHGLELPAAGNSGFDPGATLEEPHERRYLGAMMDIVGVRESRSFGSLIVSTVV